MVTHEEVNDQMVLLQAYRERLATYLQQLAVVGPADARPEIFSGIKETRTNIQRIKNTLRQWNIPIEDHPNDEENSSDFSPNQMPVDAHSMKIGSHNINIGVGNLKDTHIQIGDRYEVGSEARRISLKRSSVHPLILGGMAIRSLWLTLLGLLGMITGCVLSIVNLINFNLTAFQTGGAVLLPLVLIGSGGIFFGGGLILHFQRFIHFWGYNFERNQAGKIFITTVEGICPRCGAPLVIRNAGSAENKKIKTVCRRNPLQHSWDFDFTTLPEIGS